MNRKNKNTRRNKLPSLWGLYVLILTAIGCVIAVLSTLFVYIAIFGLTGGPGYDTQVIMTSGVAGLFTLFVALLFRERVSTGGIWIVAIATSLWIVTDIVMYGAYVLPLPFTTITCTVAWVVFVAMYRRKKSLYPSSGVAMLAVFLCVAMFLLINQLTP